MDSLVCADSPVCYGVPRQQPHRRFLSSGSRFLVTPYYSRLGHLLCLFVYPLFCILFFVCMHMCIFCFFCVFFFCCFLCSFLLQYFDTVGWVIRPVKTVGRITYIVLVQTLNPVQSIYMFTLFTVSLDVLFLTGVHTTRRYVIPSSRCCFTIQRRRIFSAKETRLPRC